MMWKIFQMKYLKKHAEPYFAEPPVDDLYMKRISKQQKMQKHFFCGISFRDSLTREQILQFSV